MKKVYANLNEQVQKDKDNFVRAFATIAADDLSIQKKLNTLALQLQTTGESPALLAALEEIDLILQGKRPLPKRIDVEVPTVEDRAERTVSMYFFDLDGEQMLTTAEIEQLVAAEQEVQDAVDMIVRSHIDNSGLKPILEFDLLDQNVSIMVVKSGYGRFSVNVDSYLSDAASKPTSQIEPSDESIAIIAHKPANDKPAKGTVLKADKNKPKLDLVPLEGLVPMAMVREFAIGKYGRDGIEAWRQISDERLLAALLRHLVAYQADPEAVDEESGLPAIYHVETNAIFLAIKAYERLANAEKGVA